MMNKVPVLSPRRRSLCWIAALACSAALLATSTASIAQSGTGPSWRELSRQEQQILQPLQTQWTSIDALRRQKWRDIAALYPNLPANQQERLRSRMAQWAAMSPEQRNAARLNYEEIRKVPAEERQARWEAYRNLPEEQRRALVAQAASRPTAAPPSTAAARGTPVAAEVQPKSNLVPSTSGQQTPRPQPVAPGTVQAGVGASTRPIARSPTPPRHQPAGLPKIAATPEFVHRETLLPQKGPQAAGTGIAAPAAPASAPAAPAESQ
jgi:hypothetical protein